MNTGRNNRKRKLILSFCFMLVLCWAFSPGVSAQNIQAEPLSHELKVYKDIDSKKLFWPKDLPVYVWLSTSDDPSSPKHRLDEASVKNEEESIPLEQSRIELELSGNQYIRWYNYETQDTVLMQFQADGIAPSSEILLSGAENFVDEVQFYGKGLKADFQAGDDHSGVANIYISVNGADFSPYFGTFDFNQEKEYLVDYYAVDHVGNAESVNSRIFTVDLNPPVTRHQIEGIHQGAILSNSATIILMSEDRLSGLRKVHYRFDNDSGETAFSGGISVSSLGEGSHSLFYRATDKVGNTEEMNQFQFYIDETNPVTDLIVEGDQFENNNFYVSGRTEYHLASSDNKTGVKFTAYQISGDSEKDYTGGSFSLPSAAGSYTISYWSEDNVSNREDKKTKEVILDTSSPVSTHDFNGAAFTQRGITWIPTTTRLTLNATDDKSGVQQIYYSIGDDLQNAEYSEAIEFQNEGKYQVEYYAADRVNNTEKPRSVTLMVDNTPPDIIANYSSSKIGSSTAEDGSVLDLYPVSTVMFLAATDESSGADKVWITLNGSREEQFTGPVTFSETGEQSIQVRSVDRVGNEKVETLRFIIAE